MTNTFIKIGAKQYSLEDIETPLERTFRDAWAINSISGVIDVDMDRAKAIWRDKIRTVRAPALQKLDEDFIRALETGASTSEIVAQKQALRDAPSDSRIDAATTPEELKLVQPAGLRIE